MVNFHDPNVIRADAVAVDRFSYVMHGLFLWEFVTTMDFEWNYVTAKRNFKWPLLLYSTCRICALGSAISALVGGNVTHEIKCQRWTTWTLTFVCGSFTCASVLITIRVIAVWSRNRFVMAVTIAMCITNVGFLIRGVAKWRSQWSDVSRKCISQNSLQGRYNIIVTTVTDIAQLIIMLIGLLRSRQEKRGFFRYFYIQGLIWLAAATIAEIPCAVFISLNLNDPWNVMFQEFSFYTMAICATRMYRALIVYDMDVHKYSHGTNVISTLRFGAAPRKRMATGTSTGNETSTGSTAAVTTDPTYVCTKDSEISLAEKVTPIGDEEAQSHKLPSLLAHDDL